MTRTATVFAHMLFWGWNALFLLFITFGIGPALLWELVAATAMGIVPWHFTGFAIVLLALPALGTALALWKLRRQPGHLLSLLFGVQAPLMMLCAVRIFAIGQLTAGTATALLLLGAGLAGLLTTLLRGPREQRPVLQAGRQLAQSVYLFGGLWLGGLLAVYMPPVLGALADASRHTLTVDLLRRPESLISLALLWMSTAMIALYPFAMVGISIRAWSVVHRHTVAHLGGALAWSLAGLAAVGVSGAFWLSGVQPQHRAHALLEAADAHPDGRAAALHHSATIRRGLLHARLSHERTLDDDPDGDHILRLYEAFVGTSAARLPQAAWRVLTRPFVYRPVHGSVAADRRWAEEAYGRFFDVPMSRAEREMLVAAARQTWMWRDAAAGILDVGEQRVWLERQEVDVIPHGDTATVRIHDVLRNATFRQQEVRLALGLPETAAVTGLWLGHSDDRDEAFRFVVAPRGAAQAVYEAEVSVRQDPALLEQVGPRQYRLRAFPIPARTGDPHDLTSWQRLGEAMHLWVELEVPLVVDAAGPRFVLPTTSEVRNLFWDRHTTRVLNGEAADAVDAWVPEAVPAPGAVRRNHDVTLSGWRVRAEVATPPRDARLGHVTVLVDTSRSMDDVRPALDHALKAIGASADSVAWWCGTDSGAAPCDDPAVQTPYGGATMLRQLQGVPDLDTEALIVVTDEGGTDRAAGDEAVERSWRGPEAPLWLIHLGTLPRAYPDTILDQIQRSGGGVATSVEELFQQLADPRVRDGWRWHVTPAEGPTTQDAFRPIAARQVVAELDRAAGHGALEHLDAVHAVAIAHEVVTPYSSMLVLVEDRQREALKRASEASDRFEREVSGDTGVQAVSTPEPGTWLLLGLGAAALSRRRRRTP